MPAKHKLLLVSLFTMPMLALACGSKPAPKACNMVSATERPGVSLAWEVAHTNMDDDPPRPAVTLIVRSTEGNKEQRVELGAFEGKCIVADVGAPPNEPVYGSIVGELRCQYAKRSMHARVIHQSPTEILIRRFELGDSEADPTGGWGGSKYTPSNTPAGQIKNARDVGTIAVPECAKFSSDLEHTDKPL